MAPPDSGAPKQWSSNASPKTGSGPDSFGASKSGDAGPKSQTRILYNPKDPLSDQRGSLSEGLPGVKPGAKRLPGVIKAFAAAIMLGALAGACWAFFLREDPAPARAVAAMENKPRPSYAKTRLASDFGSVKAVYGPQKRVNALIEHQGPETRLYAHLASVLSPGSCPEAKAVKILSDDASERLSLVGACGATGSLPGEILIKWDDKIIVASMFIGENEATTTIPAAAP